MTQTIVAGPPASTESTHAGTMRRDIQGLRALAVLLVLVFHLWPNRLTGGYIGVDIFFVISGYLITSHLLGVPPHGLRDVGSFWARRIRRLLPASFLVLGVTLLASRIIAPETQWANTAREVRDATLYVVNWRLASNSVDYLAADDAPSPVQHFWSLSVEEQFYLGWPLLILLLALLAVRLRRDELTTILAGLALVVTASFAYGVWMAEHDPARGYFVTPTRIWELGVGALLAGVVIRRRRSGRGTVVRAGPWRRVAVVAGLASIAWAGFTYDGATPFPGWHAAIPILGCALLIAVGPSAGPPATVDRILDNPAAVRIGDISYSVYLWHWPMIVLLPSISGDHLGRLDKAAILVATFVLAALTKVWVEDRFRRPRAGSRSGSTPVRTVFLLAVAGMAVLVGLSALQVAEVSQRQESSRAKLQDALRGDQRCFGANATADDADCPESRSGDVVPEPAQAVEDRGKAFYDDCRQIDPFEQTATCTFGDPNGSIEVAIAGNSHSLHWVPALDRIGRESRWKVTTYIAAGCPAIDMRVGARNQRSADGCFAWGQRVREKVAEGGFDLVFMSTISHDYWDHDAASYARATRGYRSYLEKLVDAGGPPVLVIRDVPDPRATLPVEVTDCVAQHRSDLEACSGPRSSWVQKDALARAAREMNHDDVDVLDLTDRFCDGSRCRSVIGGVIVYADRAHLTATYSTSLAQFIAEPAIRTMDLD